MNNAMVHISSYLTDYLNQLQLRIDTMPTTISARQIVVADSTLPLITVQRFGSETRSDFTTQFRQAIAQLATVSHTQSSAPVWVIADQAPLGSWGAHFVSAQSGIPIEQLLTHPILDINLPRITEAIEAIRQTGIWLSHRQLSCQDLLVGVRGSHENGRMIAMAIIQDTLFVDMKRAAQKSLFEDDARPIEVDCAKLLLSLTGVRLITLQHSALVAELRRG